MKNFIRNILFAFATLTSFSSCSPRLHKLRLVKVEPKRDQEVKDRELLACNTPVEEVELQQQEVILSAHGSPETRSLTNRLSFKEADHFQASAAPQIDHKRTHHKTRFKNEKALRKRHSTVREIDWADCWETFIGYVIYVLMGALTYFICWGLGQLIITVPILGYTLAAALIAGLIVGIFWVVIICIAICNL